MNTEFVDFLDINPFLINVVDVVHNMSLFQFLEIGLNKPLCVLNLTIIMIT